MKKILVFPCGSEIGLTIHDSLRHMNEIELWGASSVDDHGRFIYKNYIGGVPSVGDADFIGGINEVCEKYGIDYIYPAHDDVLVALSGADVGAEVIAPSATACKICREKRVTYSVFSEISPKMFPDEIHRLEYSVFVKPNRGQGSKGCGIAHTGDELKRLLSVGSDMLTIEYLPGPEFTVDCFTDRHGNLLFCEGRNRTRIKTGIAVRTERVQRPEFREFAELIMTRLEMRGQWFFQVKERADGELKLLEIAPRPAGSSILWTAHDVYLPKLTVLDRMGQDVEINFYDQRVEMDRALNHRFYYHKKAV